MLAIDVIRSAAASSCVNADSHPKGPCYRYSLARTVLARLLRGPRRGGRVVEGARLLSGYTVKSRIVGSNPILSASTAAAAADHPYIR